MDMVNRFSPHNEVAVLPLRHEVMARVPPSQDESHLRKEGRKEGELVRHVNHFPAALFETNLWLGVLSRALLIEVTKLWVLAVLDGVPPVIPAVGCFLEVIDQNEKMWDLIKMEHSSTTGIFFQTWRCSLTIRCLLCFCVLGVRGGNSNAIYR